LADNSETIHRLYRAFAALDAKTMAECYAIDARFTDEVFTLSGRREIGGMWAMLCDVIKAKGADVWSLKYGEVTGVGDKGSAHWEARYRFSATGRLVENQIDATMRFDASGLITEHVDHFDFWRWSRQALGAPGVLLGWTSLLKGKVQAQATDALRACRPQTLGGKAERDQADLQRERGRQAERRTRPRHLTALPHGACFQPVGEIWPRRRERSSDDASSR